MKIWPLQSGRGTIFVMPLTLHAAWLRVDTPFSNGRLFFWAENTDTSLADTSLADTVAGSTGNDGTDSAGISARTEPNGRVRSEKIPSHPFQASVGQVRALLVDSSPTLQSDSLKLATATIWLPSHAGLPMARRSVLHQTRIDADAAGSAPLPIPLSTAEPSLMPWQLTGVSLDPVDALIFLSHLSNQSARGVTIDRPDTWRRLRLGNDLLFWSNASKVVLEILAGQHYLPSLRPDDMGHILSSWQTSLLDARVEKQVAHLVRILPPVCRAYDIAAIAEAPPAGLLVEHFLSTMVDVMIRQWAGGLLPPYTNAPVSAWIYGLLTAQRQMPLGPQAAHQIYRDWRSWTEQLHVSTDANFRICFALTDPGSDDPLATGDLNGESFEPERQSGEEAAQLIDSGQGHAWRLRYFLQSRDNATLLVPARDVWETQETVLRIGHRRLDRPQERLLAGLGVASKLFKPIADSMRSPQPEGADLTASEAYHFLREIGPLLESSGFGLLLPEWWSGRRHARLGLRLRLLAGEPGKEDLWPEETPLNERDSVRYAWELTLGGNRLSQDEFDHLAGLQTPLVNMHDRWVELDPAQIESAKQFLQQQSNGSMTFLQSLRMAQGHMGRAEILNELTTGSAIDDLHIDDLHMGDEIGLLDEMPGVLPLESVNVEGWLQVVLNQLRTQQPPEELAEPHGFIGTLRPYQKRGVGWLHYLRELGIGACLADDMGLGKTIQALALLLFERQRHAKAHNGDGSRVAPTLLICPTSVVANWKHEIDRFAPGLHALIHHGIDRLSGPEFLQAMTVNDLAITSFGTARRDIDLLEQLEWGDLILDEAQNIKNPRAKQTQAVRRLACVQPDCADRHAGGKSTG